MGRGGVSLGKTVKGAGLNDLDQQQITDSEHPDTGQKPAAAADPVDPRHQRWLQFVAETRALHLQQRQRLGAMLAQCRDGAGPGSRVSVRLLLDEMKSVSRSAWLRTAQDAIADLRGAVSRHADAESSALADLDTSLRLSRDGYDRAGAQVADLRTLFEAHLERMCRDLVQVRDSMTGVLGQDLDQIAAAFHAVLARDRAATLAVQAQERDAAAVADSEFVQAREAAKDQEQLSTLRLQLSAQMETYETEFASRHADYVNVNGERQKEFIDMMGRDSHYSDVIHCNNSQYHRLSLRYHRSRIQLSQHRLYHRQINHGLRLEINNMLAHVRDLRRSLHGHRQSRAQARAQMSATAALVRTRLQQRLQQSDRILRLHRAVLARGGGSSGQAQDRARLQLVALRHERDRRQLEQMRLRNQIKAVVGPTAAAASVQHLLRINGR